MQSLFGLALLLAAATFSGVIIGAVFAVATTSINNFVVSPFFGASMGTYSFWIKFYMGIGGFGGLFISVCWGAILVYKKMATH